MKRYIGLRKAGEIGSKKPGNRERFQVFASNSQHLRVRSETQGANMQTEVAHVLTIPSHDPDMAKWTTTFPARMSTPKTEPKAAPRRASCRSFK
jgi:hypothetical protein